MALAQITYPVKKGSSGGGGIGGIIGGTIGAIGGAIVGGPTGALSGFGAGSTIGGMVGNQVSPQVGPSRMEAIPTNESALRAKMIDPAATLASLNDSLVALQRSPEQDRALYAPIFQTALDHVRYTSAGV